MPHAASFLHILSGSTWPRTSLSGQANYISPPPFNIPIPERRYSHIHVDLVGPLPPSQGCTCIFTMVDRTTRWREAVPLSTITAVACAGALCSAWIYRFCIPHTITSDPWHSIHLFHLVSTFLISAHFSHYHHSLPSTVQWHGSIVDSRTPCEHVVLHPIGLLTFLGVSWLSVPLLTSGSCFWHPAGPAWRVSSLSWGWFFSFFDQPEHLSFLLSNFCTCSSTRSGHSSSSHDNSIRFHPGSSQSSSALTFQCRSWQGPASLSSLFFASIGWSPGDSLCLSPQVSPPPTQHSACPASQARPAFLFLILYLLSSRKLPKIPPRLPIRCPSSVLCLPLDPLGLKNFLLVFWISFLILDEILGGNHVESLKIGLLENATSLYICRMWIVFSEIY